MDKFEGTLLPQKNEPLEIQKGILDLLAKINKVVDYVKSVFGVVTEELEKKATNFPGICAKCPILENDISINYTTRVLTINPPLGAFNFFVDGNGVVTKYTKTGPVVFPAFTDTSGIWFFHFDFNGNPITTQTPWSSFDNIAPVYRLLWNATLTGDAKSTVEAFECHLNTISGIDHSWKHTVGTIWRSGGNCVNNLTTAGVPNADGRNSVISLTTLSCLDDNLPYTVTNSTGGLKFQQDMGNITAASLNATNSGLFKIRFQTGTNLTNTLPATRFPFAWATASNRPEFITANGTRTLVDNLNFFVYYIYVIQDPRTGEAVRSVSDPNQFTTLTQAQASSWASIQSVYSTLNDSEIRPLHKLTFEYKQTWDAGCKYSVLREVADIRKQQIAQLALLSGSLPASSVTVIPTTNIAATNAQAAIDELDTEKSHKPNGTINTIGFMNAVASPLCANGQTGGVYAVIAFTAANALCGALGGVAQGTNLSTLFGATVASHVYWRNT